MAHQLAVTILLAATLTACDADPQRVPSPADAASRRPYSDPSRSRAVNGAECNNLTLGPLIDTVSRTQVVEIKGGGTIQDGVYDTVFHEIGGGTNSDRAVWTLEVRGDQYAWVMLLYRARTYEPDFEDRARGQLTTAGTTVMLRRTCGGSGTRTFGYTADGDQLALQEPGLLLRFIRRSR